MQLPILSRISQEAFGSSLNQYLSKKPSSHYKVYKIPKRTFGFRVIAQPTPQLKNIQREIVGELKEHLQVHPAANAYVENRGIKNNALVHAKSNYLLKLDLENFFNSLTPEMLVEALLYQNKQFVEEENAALIELLFWNRTKKKLQNYVLSVGAPSSPFLSNIIMYSFDEAVAQSCDELGVTYSRYADDLTFSTTKKNVLFKVPELIESILLKVFYGKLKLNHSKTTFSSKAHNRRVTGVTLTNNNKISLGRERKRYIRSLLHKYSGGKLDEYSVFELKGLIGFALNIEPLFVERMRTHYGSEVFDNLNNYKNGDY
ncbi:retron St85 family RNA-directed DNA polymerase [Vibrio harveyi]|nr:retron St85 family RNA-directed DNA polymerase [Vibrio harveyi]EMB9228035.1 retron St85 family RNA-directed DNA polymerase [Vibrio harveyi]